MKIAINTRLLLPNRLEGVGWFTHEVVRRLVARHPEWEFFFFFDRPYDESFLFGPNVTPLAVAPPARHPALWLLWFQAAVPRVLRRLRPDVFLSPDGHCSLTSRTPTALVVHDIAHAHFPEQVPFLARQYYDYFMPRFLRRAEQLITVSDFSRKDISRHYGIASDRIAVCGNGARPEFRPLPEQEKEEARRRYAGSQPYFFCLGSVNPRKNLPRLLWAFNVFKANTGAPVKLLIAGAFGWLTGQVKAVFEQSVYRDDIVFLGYVPEDNLPSLLGAALALTYVSLFEGFGLPILEALHSDVPVLASNTSSIPEVAGEAALLVDPLDIGAIAKAMEQLSADGRLRDSLVEKGRRQRRRFSWEQTTDVVEACCTSCVRGQ